MSWIQDIVNNFCIYGDLYIKNTNDYIGISVSNETSQLSYLHKKQKTTKHKVIYKKIK